MRKIGDTIVVLATTTIQKLPDSYFIFQSSGDRKLRLLGFQPLGEILLQMQ
jgi:hypothetical protein